jgi:hypothetical protein
VSVKKEFQRKQLVEKLRGEKRHLDDQGASPLLRTRIAQAIHETEDLVKELEEAHERINSQDEILKNIAHEAMHSVYETNRG